MTFSDKNYREYSLDQSNQRKDLSDNSYFFTQNEKLLLGRKLDAQIRYKVLDSKDNDGVADINVKEKENVKDIKEYQAYQENIQDNTPWASSSDIRIVDSDKLPNPNPIIDTEGCPECGNIQAYWWIVQTDSADEPSTQFFRCTNCNNTWRIPKTS